MSANNANQNLTHNTNTQINMQTEQWDTDTIHSTAANTYRHDINTAGTYLQFAGGQFAYAAAGIRSIFLQENGTTRTAEALIPGPSAIQAGDPLQCGHTGLMTTADYIDLYGYQNSGGTVAVQSGTVFMLSHWCGNP